MQTRIIHTKVWEDGWFHKLSKDAKYLWIYLLINSKINISGIFELPDDKILYDTSIASYQELEILKTELSPKAEFFDGWIKIVNVEKYNKYRNSPLNEKAYYKEISFIPSKVKEKFGISGDTSIDTSIYTTPIPLEIINNKSEIRNQKQGIRNNYRNWVEEECKKTNKLLGNGKNQEEEEDLPF